MKYLIPQLLLVCSVLFLAACGTLESTDQLQKNGEKPSQISTAPRLVGKIASMPADRRFVLIQSYGKWNIATGSILTTRGPDERTANLLATGESLGEFAAADVQSGTVEVGDGVYSRHVPKPIAATETPETSQTPDSQPIPLPEKLQKNN